MSERITVKHLRPLVDRLNEVTGSPKEPYMRVDGRYHANLGNYHLSGQYGGWSLERMATDGGGVNTIFHTGTAREIYDKIHAYLAGFSEGAK